MAYTNINVLKSEGLFKANSQTFAAVTNGSMEFSVSDTKNPLSLFVDIPSGATGTFTLAFEKKAGKTISLAAQKLNVVQITTKELVAADGKIRFTLSTSNSSGITGLNIKIAIVSHTPVVNH